MANGGGQEHLGPSTAFTPTRKAHAVINSGTSLLVRALAAVRVAAKVVYPRRRVTTLMVLLFTVAQSRFQQVHYCQGGRVHHRVIRSADVPTTVSP